MKYYYDCEFLEGKQDKRFLGLKYGETKPTIDLISIGIVSEDDREYYAISKDFNLKESWNRWDGEYHELGAYEKYHQFPSRKKYWIRENVLKPIYKELLTIANKDWRIYSIKDNFNYSNLKYLINRYGKTNKQIAQEVFEFISQDELTIEKAKFYNQHYEDIHLYGYYSAYDHVALCWLFGKMIDLPKGFPMYTKDLKQEFDEKQKEWVKRNENKRTKTCLENKEFSVEVDLKKLSKYPKQSNEHNALSDAKWNKELHEFIKSLK